MIMIVTTNINKFLNNFLVIFNVKPRVIHLGRWNIENCNKRINKKIDLANEDHSGPYGNNLIKENTILIYYDV